MVWATAALLVQGERQTEDYCFTALRWLARHQSEDGSWSTGSLGRMIRKDQVPCRCAQIPLPPAAPCAALSDEESKRVADLVASLGSDSYDEREAASRAILSIGRRAEPSIVEHQKRSDDPEVQARLALLLEALRPMDRSLNTIVFMTGLAMCHFLGAGYTHLSKDTYDGICFGSTVRDGLRFLIRAIEDPKLSVLARASAAFAIAEAYSMTSSAIIKEHAGGAVEAVLRDQNADGGWALDRRGEPSHPMSTHLALEALTSAEAAELCMSARAYDQALKYLASLDRDGLPDDPAKLALIALGRIYLTRHRTNGVTPAVEKLHSALSHSGKEFDSYWLWVGSQAMMRHDGPQGPNWKRWTDRLKPILREKLQKDRTSCDWGTSIEDSAHPEWGRIYSTCLSGLNLEVYKRRTTVFIQR